MNPHAVDIQFILNDGAEKHRVGFNICSNKDFLSMSHNVILHLGSNMTTLKTVDQAFLVANEYVGDATVLRRAPK